jgi:hypothetical protein
MPSSVDRDIPTRFAVMVSRESVSVSIAKWLHLSISLAQLVKSCSLKTVL